MTRGDIKSLGGQGEVVSMIGGNSAGKSTLLETIFGIMAPARGQIAFEGSPIHRSPPEASVERGIIHVPEGRRSTFQNKPGR